MNKRTLIKTIGEFLAMLLCVVLLVGLILLGSVSHWFTALALVIILGLVFLDLYKKNLEE